MVQFSAGDVQQDEVDGMIYLDDLIEATGGALPNGAAATEFSGFAGC